MPNQSPLFPPIQISDMGRTGVIMVSGGNAFMCAVQSPSVGESLTAGTPVLIQGTCAGDIVLVQPKVNGLILGYASIVGGTWSLWWTPAPGDVGTPTLGATATNTSGAQVNAPSVQVSVAAAPVVAWAPFFPGAYQILQPDLVGAVTYGSTLLHTAGTGPVITLTGTLSGAPTSITVTCPITGGALGAWQGVVTYGDGTTQAFASAATVPLTGRGAGLTLNIAAGTAVVTDVWKATCASILDQSGNAKHGVQATASLQGLVTAGVNGCACIASDGVDDILLTNGLNLPAPGTTPYYVFAVFRYLTATADAVLLGNGDAAVSNLVTSPVGGASISQMNPSTVAASGVVPTDWNILEIKRSNNAGDTIKVGAVTATGNAGNNAVTNGRVFQSPGAGPAGRAELAALVYTPNLPNWSAVSAAVTSKYNGLVSI